MPLVCTGVAAISHVSSIGATISSARRALIILQVCIGNAVHLKERLISSNFELIFAAFGQNVSFCVIV